MSFLDFFRPKAYDPDNSLDHPVEDDTNDKITIHSEGISKESDEPWCEIKGEYDSEHGMKFTTDWNDSFIEDLRTYGYQGTEEQIMQQYLLITYKTIIEREEEDGKPTL